MTDVSGRTEDDRDTVMGVHLRGAFLVSRAAQQHVGITFEEYQQRASASMPVGRVGRPDDIAHVVSFLASERAGFVSGQVVYAAGGPRS